MRDKQQAQRVIVVGGGIGGLITSAILQRHGIEVTVLERAERFDRIGGAIQLGPQALRILDDLGMLDALRRHGVRADAMAYERWADLTTLMQSPIGEAAEREFGAPTLNLLRPDIQDVLVAHCPEGCLRMGATVVGLNQNSEGVDVELHTGERIQADLVVAADGIRSGIRQMFTGVENPTYSGTVVYRGLVQRDEVPDEFMSNVNRYILGGGKHLVLYWVNGGRQLSINVAVQRPWGEESWTDNVKSAEASAGFEDWHPSVKRLVETAPEVIRTAVFIREPIKHWVFGRVALLGDAAHAMVPFRAQGAVQAIEDAWVLGECLRHHPRQLQMKALARYEQLRMDRAFEEARSSAGLGDVFNMPDGQEQIERDREFSTLTSLLPFGPRQAAWSFDIRTTKAEELKSA